MLRSVQDLEGFAIRATDGTIGHVRDLYFDDKTWAVRYLVVETGSWLSSRKVLISPIAIGHPDWKARVLPVSITQQQVRNSPDIDTDKPVSRQHEMLYLGYYGYPYYWTGGGLWGQGACPGTMPPGPGGVGSDAQADAVCDDGQQGDPHLRSGNALVTYHIEASDGGMGHVQWLLFDPETWAIRYLIVDTSNWWLGHQVLIAPQWIQNVSWPDATVSVGLTQQAVKDAPPYDSTAPLLRNDEVRLYKHHGRASYWADEQAPAKAPRRARVPRHKAYSRKPTTV